CCFYHMVVPTGLGCLFLLLLPYGRPSGTWCSFPVVISTIWSSLRDLVVRSCRDFYHMVVPTGLVVCFCHFINRHFEFTFRRDPLRIHLQFQCPLVNDLLKSVSQCLMYSHCAANNRRRKGRI